MDTATATAVKDAAAKAWIAAGRPATGAERAALDDALRALAAAKRAAEAAERAGQPSADERLAAFARAGGVVKSAAVRRMEAEAPLRRAKRLLAAASEWPRCGDNWPQTAGEEKADALLRQHYGSIDRAMEEMEIFS
jgi:hypothetical protein